MRSLDGITTTDDDVHGGSGGARQDLLEVIPEKVKGSRVKTAMEKRLEEEQPRRWEMAWWSNDVIEEARSKLLEKRQCSRVKALLGAFETIMDAEPAGDGATTIAGKPQHYLHRRQTAALPPRHPAAYPNEKSERERERGERESRRGGERVMTWSADMWGPRGSHANSAATLDKTGLKTVKGPRVTGFD
ncbi:Os11g0440422 [Oryza sativa Japonica Group]|uniref:Os11g0440422 protein n=1 Tax=Oryza sativa subsp. japonica TaxID=39947 RepID=A0A0P0Y226_ORYSJ|nr:hypothetical protein EE612_055262 [Oryza sativa]BAT13868.1 Os11g0440422 [Oryza sativa Japonica Group]